MLLIQNNVLGRNELNCFKGTWSFGIKGGSKTLGGPMNLNDAIILNQDIQEWRDSERYYAYYMAGREGSPYQKWSQQPLHSLPPS